nr:TRAP transporter small permease [uncultured Celeribacter sp.]
MYNRLERILAQIAGALAWVAYLALVLMALHVTASVLSRWILGRDIPITTELATYYYMVALTYLPLAFVDRRNAHLFAEFLYVMLPGRFQRFLDVLNSHLALAFFLFLTWRTAVDAVERTRSGDVISTATGLFPVWPARWLVPIGLFAASFVILFRCYETLRAMWVGQSVQDSAQIVHQEGDLT